MSIVEAKLNTATTLVTTASLLGLHMPSVP